jgi:hypothetical protein
MSYATDSDLTARIPGVSAVSSTLRQIALDDAEAMIDDSLFGDRTVRAHCYLAAHYLAAIPGSGFTAGNAGAVTAMSAGEISASYASPTLATEGHHSSTTWGRLFDEIAASVLHSPEVG